MKYGVWIGIYIAFQLTNHLGFLYSWSCFIKTQNLSIIPAKSGVREKALKRILCGVLGFFSWSASDDAATSNAVLFVVIYRSIFRIKTDVCTLQLEKSIEQNVIRNAASPRCLKLIFTLLCNVFLSYRAMREVVTSLVTMVSFPALPRCRCRKGPMALLKLSGELLSGFYPQ